MESRNKKKLDKTRERRAKVRESEKSENYALRMNSTNGFQYILIGFIIQTSHHAEIPSDADADAHAAQSELQVVLGHYRRMVQVAAKTRASTTATAAAATTTSAGLLRSDDRLLLLLLAVVVLLGGFQRVVLHFVLLFAFAPRLELQLLPMLVDGGIQ